MADQWPQWMNTQTAAQYADVSTRTIARWLDLGLPASRPSGTRRINRQVFDRWLIERSHSVVSGRQATTSEGL